MPCRDNSKLSTKSSSNLQLQEILQTRLDDVTRMLCSTLRELEKEAYSSDHDARFVYDGLSPETKAWWVLHKEADARRENQETAKKAHKKALDKVTAIFNTLSNEEKKLLGIEIIKAKEN